MDELSPRAQEVMAEHGLAIVRAYIDDKWTVEKIRKHFGCGRKIVLVILEACGVKLKARETYNGSTVVNPTRREIAAHCARIQKTWSEQEELERQVGRHREPYEFPVTTFIG